MSDNSENQSSNPLTHRHEAKIDAMKDDVTKLQLTVYGDKESDVDGLVEKIKTLKDGQKLLTRQNIIMVAVAITGIAAVISAIYPFLSNG